MHQIKWEASYYTDHTKQNVWCDECFAVLQDDQLLTLDDGTQARKTDLEKCESNTLAEESWIHCDHCNSWVHEICSLFNGRVNRTATQYTCPNCYLSKGHSDIATSKEIKFAADLPHCKMSEAIEGGVLTALENAYKDRSEQLGLSLENVEKAESLSIRVVSNSETKHEVGEEVR